MALPSLIFFIIIGFNSSGQANDALPVSLTQNDSGASVVLTQGQNLNVSLHQTHANGGYIWRVVPGAESKLQQVQEQCIPDSPCPPGMVGCPSMCTFTFIAIATGQVSLKIIERRPWETNVDPLQIFEVTALVNAVPVPTMTEWGMMLFATVAGLSSVYYLMRRKMSWLHLATEFFCKS